MTAAILLNTTDDYFYTVVHIAFIAILTKFCTRRVVEDIRICTARRRNAVQGFVRIAITACIRWSWNCSRHVPPPPDTSPAAK